MERLHFSSLDWARKVKKISHVRMVFLIHLRGFASDPNVGLKELIGCYFSGHPGMEDIMAYTMKHNGLGLCFILDGLDEYLPANKDAYIFQLIKRRVLPKSVVIVASRPAAAADFRSIATKQIGFLRPQINDYIPFQWFANPKNFTNTLMSIQIYYTRATCQSILLSLRYKCKPS